MSGPPTITAPHLLALYRALQRASTRFASYNFRNYFLHRNRDTFRQFLADGQRAADPQAAREFWQTQRQELEVLRRSAMVNRLFEAPRLVVERPRVITSGGGAGAEASAGGAGQPVDPEHPAVTSGEQAGERVPERQYEDVPTGSRRS